jgi:hypothetical protein
MQKPRKNHTDHQFWPNLSPGLCAGGLPVRLFDISVSYQWLSE